MFPRSAIGTRVSTRSQSQTMSAAQPPSKKLAGNENTSAARAALTQKGSSAIVAKQFAVPTNTVATATGTRKRRALHDLSNNQPAAPSAINGEKAAAVKASGNARVKAVAVTTKVQQIQVQVEQPARKTAVERPAVVAVAKSSSTVKQVVKTVAASNGMAFEPKSLSKITLASPGYKRQKTDAEMAVGWTNLDGDDDGDITMASEYVVEIFDYMRHLEVQTMPTPNYMDTQKELQWKMRSILIDWLVEVHLKFRLMPETMFLTVNLIDRFLSKRAVALSKLQLVGMTAMFIAAKYEEVYAPSINQFVYIADKSYSNEDIIKAERYLLSTLNFDIQYPNPLNFLRRCSKADEYDVQTRTVAKYLIEITLLDEGFIACTPSIIAAASLYLGRAMLDRDVWDINLIHYSGYSVADLQPVAVKLLEYLSRNRRYQSIYNKYSSSRYMKASVFVEEWLADRVDLADWGLEWE